MKKNGSRPAYVIVFALIAAVYIAVSVGFTVSFGLNDESPRLSSHNSGKNGGSLIYDALANMDYPVSRYYGPIDRGSDSGAVQIVVGPDPNYADADRALDWVTTGGRLIWLDEPHLLRRMFTREGMTPADYAGGLYIFDLGFGQVALGPSSGLTNGALAADASAGRAVENVLSGWNAERIYFNEYYHGYASAPGFFGELPMYARLAAVQLILAAAATAWRLGKRFGAPAPYYEESERDENEYITALANLYERSGIDRVKYERLIVTGERGT